MGSARDRTSVRCTQVELKEKRRGEKNRVVLHGIESGSTDTEG